MPKRRLDILLVEKGLAETIEKAKAIVMAADVLVNDLVVDKPGTLVDDSASLRVLASPPFVSRGGFKLAHALNEFQIDVAGMVAADIGASTGGFTDCLLQREARRVYAIDVGYGQLDYRLRMDERVVIMERVNARYPFELPEEVDLGTVDVSFISLQKVLPNVAPLLKKSGYLVVLVKPQFEAVREQVGKGGLVKDPLVHAQVLGRFILWAVDHRLRLWGLTPSPILGAEGNREFFVLLAKQ
jgi:23S rRNA (cytidine1920-2'-O)/16S rRNA (cytidine1409-2'-O)-methyltransferase